MTPVSFLEGYIATLAILLGVFLYWLPDLTPRTIRLGVRVPPERTDDPAVLRSIRRFRAGSLLSLALALLAIVGIPATGIGGIADRLVPVAGIFLLVAGSLVSYVVFRGQLLHVKEEEHWMQGRAGMSVAAGWSAPKPSARHLGLWILPSLLLLGAVWGAGLFLYPGLPAEIPVHYTLSGSVNAWAPKSFLVAFSLPLVGAAILTLFALLSWVITRTRTELGPREDWASEHRRQGIFRERMAALLLGVAAIVEAQLAFLSLLLWGAIAPPASGWVLAVALAPALLVVALVLTVSVRTGQLGARIPAPAGPAGGPSSGPSVRAYGPERDDDRFWKGGILYYNPDDSSILVAKRFGVGWTFNFGHPVAWVALLAPFLLLGIALVLLTHL